MTEKFIDSDDPQQPSEITAFGLLRELAIVDDQRTDIYQTADQIDAVSVNRSIDVLQHDYDPRGAVRQRIKTLEGYIAVVETQMAILDNRTSAVEERRLGPQRVSDQAMQTIQKIYQQKKDIVREIREVQRQQDTAANRQKIYELKREKDFTLAARHERASDVQIHADAEIERLNGILSIITSDKDVCLARLAEYDTEIRLLREKIEKVSAAIGQLASAMSEVKTVASETNGWSAVALPERLHDLDMDSIVQPVSYGEHMSSDLQADQTAVSQSPQHPTNTLDFPSDIVTVETHYEYTVPETVAQPASLEPLLREGAIKARKPIAAPKKSKGIKRLFKVN